MSLYKFRIKRKDTEITLSSESSKLIASEYNQFVAKFLNVNFNEVLKENDISKKKTTKKVSTKTNKKVTLKVESNETNIKEFPKKETKIKKPTKLPDNFAQMLADKSSEKNHVIEKKTSELKNTYIQMQQVISEKQLTDTVDYIVASAYCLTHYEKLSHFTEEQIKSKITPFFDKEIQHDYILDAIAKSFIKILPDFTGTSTDVEYELTENGEDYFLNTL